MDQYKHPHESTHTIREVIGWLDKAGLRFVKSIPKTNWRSFSPFLGNGCTAAGLAFSTA